MSVVNCRPRRGVCDEVFVTRYTGLPHRITCLEPNEIGYAKINIELNSGTAASNFFSFSDSVITT